MTKIYKSSTYLLIVSCRDTLFTMAIVIISTKCYKTISLILVNLSSFYQTAKINSLFKYSKYLYLKKLKVKYTKKKIKFP